MGLYEIGFEEDVCKSVRAVRVARALENGLGVARAEQLDDKFSALREGEILLGREEAADQGERVAELLAAAAGRDQLVTH